MGAFVSTLQAGCIAIDRAQITAGDLAKADREFARLDPNLIFSFAPAIGGQRNVPAPEIESWAAQHGLGGAPRSAACFERTSRELSPEDIVEAVRTALGSGFEDLRIGVVDICNCKVPAGKLEFTRNGASLPPEKHPDTPVLWKGRLLAADGDVYPVWARIQILATVTVVRAARNLRPQQALRGEEIEEVKISASPLRFGQIQTAAAYAGKIVNTSIEQGTILEPKMVHVPLDVERGSLVRVEVVNGGTVLELDAKAETGGNLGEPIVLTNPAGAARFRAYVTGPGHAQVAVIGKSLAGETAIHESGPANTGSGRGF